VVEELGDGDHGEFGSAGLIGCDGANARDQGAVDGARVI
jgi:hypothetical protein